MTAAQHAQTVRPGGVRQESMRIAGERVDADGVMEVLYPYDEMVIGDDIGLEVLTL